MSSIIQDAINKVLMSCPLDCPSFFSLSLSNQSSAAGVGFVCCGKYKCLQLQEQLIKINIVFGQCLDSIC